MTIQPTQEKPPLTNLTRETHEGLASVIVLLAICDILPFLILMLIGLQILPLFAPLAFVPIIFSLNQSCKSFRKLQNLSPHEGMNLPKL